MRIVGIHSKQRIATSASAGLSLFASFSYDQKRPFSSQVVPE